MSRPKLSYFDVPRGRGEVCRLALCVADADYEADGVRGIAWPDLKEGTPYGQLPIYQVDGQPPIGRENAILALIGRQHGLHPTDPWEAARHEALMDAIDEVNVEIEVIHRLHGDGERQRIREELAQGPLPAWFDRFERQVRGPFVGGDAMQVADLKLFVLIDILRSGHVGPMPSTLFVGYDRLLALHEAVGAHPDVEDWYLDQ